jgi:DNA (cytosine-5)-methyltransferase 1
VDITKPNKTVISFCTGYGGIELGLRIAGLSHRTICYIEREAYPIANLVSKIENDQLDQAPIWSDLKTFPSTKFRGLVDIITGGYPCQPFSQAGRKKAQDDPRHLWPHLLFHIRAIRPKQVFFENVEGHINRGLEEVIEDLESSGYDATWGIFSAAEVGARHQRKRVFILGNAKYDGLHGSENGRWCDKASHGSQEGQESTGQPERASRRKDSRDLQDMQARWRSIQAQITCSPESLSSESQFCRTIDAAPNRVDRLRLLGNGVVPKQAALAYLTLSDRLNDL